jgi:hypothetical protein
VQAGGHAAHHLGNVAGVELGIAGIDALGREREEEVLADLHAGLLEQRQQQLLGGARIGGALEDHEHPAVEVCARAARSRRR